MVFEGCFPEFQPYKSEVGTWEEKTFGDLNKLIIVGCDYCHNKGKTTFPPFFGINCSIQALDSTKFIFHILIPCDSFLFPSHKPIKSRLGSKFHKLFISETAFFG
jgi:hypothetical protein